MVVTMALILKADAASALGKTFCLALGVVCAQLFEMLGGRRELGKGSRKAFGTATRLVRMESGRRKMVRGLTDTTLTSRSRCLWRQGSIEVQAFRVVSVR